MPTERISLDPSELIHKTLSHTCALFDVHDAEDEGVDTRPPFDEDCIACSQHTLLRIHAKKRYAWVMNVTALLDAMNPHQASYIQEIRLALLRYIICYRARQFDEAGEHLDSINLSNCVQRFGLVHIDALAKIHKWRDELNHT